MKRIIDFVIVGIVACIIYGVGVLPGCASVQKVAKKTLDCAEPKIVARAMEVAPQVFDKLCKSSSSWENELDQLIFALGDVGVCAVMAVVDELKTRPKPPEAWGISYFAKDSSASIQIARAEKWLASNGF